MEDPKRTLWQCTASVCVVGVHCWEISLGLDPGNVICLSVLSIYPRFFFCVFIVYCRVLFCCMLMRVDCFGLVVSTCPPFPLGRICYVVLVMWKGGESSWSGPCHLCCSLEVFHMLPVCSPHYKLPGPVHTAWLGRMCFLFAYLA